MEAKQTDQTEQANNSQSLIFYIRDKKHNPYGVLLAKKNGNSVSIGYSLCCKKDTFNKKMGRLIAEGRANVYKNSSLIAIKHLNRQTDSFWEHASDNENRTVKIPEGMQDTISEFVRRCREHYDECRFPSWTDLV